MNFRIVFLYIFFVLFSCSNKKELQDLPIERKQELSTKESYKKEGVSKSSEEVDNSSDCVFDDDCEKSTSEWLKELGITKFFWIEEETKAYLIVENELVKVCHGGCTHFTTSVECSVPSYLGETALIEKCISLSSQFKFVYYSNQLKLGNYKMYEDNGKVFFDFEDDDPEDNLIYLGIECSKSTDSTKIKIVEYLN
ncbi:hypothetical protein OX284_006655 [Flavobacterium sp. SUN046]|uniref:hypothetical protein n=1 Tax=Flavobacterium sp. SUN046 TaxID=3002440 RepID=UPI002DBDC301|nr:hypothetical protein [Flavobacterium sp. SUN046]MEC4049103.1 hypothetical protein [Flavobacterium sp. SUN046]